MTNDSKSSLSGSSGVKTKSDASGPGLSSTIPQFNLKSSNLATTWKNWFNQFKIYIRASNLEKQPDSRKVALLLHHMGPESFEIFNSFDKNLDEVTYEDLVKEFQAYFLPKVNIAMERHNFFSRSQKMDESIDEYVTVLKNLSLTCEFGALRENLVRDIFVCGLHDTYTYIKERLLNEGDIKLEKAVEISRAIVITKEHSQNLQHPNGNSTFIGALSKKNFSHANRNRQLKSIHFNKVTHQQSFHNTSPNKINQFSHPQVNNKFHRSNTQPNKPIHCSRCGEIHKYRCPALGVVCKKCGGKNHYAKMCRSKIYIRNVEAESNTSSESDVLFLGSLELSSTSLSDVSFGINSINLEIYVSICWIYMLGIFLSLVLKTL